MSAQKASPAVAIVILNWNNAPDTIECLESTSRLDYANLRTLVVDNGSTDGSAEAIRAAYPDIEILALEGNLGYAEGNNVGIREALKQSPDYVFVLNNDVFLEPDALTRLVAAMEAAPQAAMAGPRVYCTDPAGAIFAEGSFVRWSRGRIEHRGMYGRADENLTGPEPVDFLVGCGVLIRSSLIERIGLLDPGFFLNYEDVEWGVRAARSGFRSLYVPDAVLYHKVSATLGPGSAANTYYMTRNGLRFFWNNAPGMSRFLSTALIVLRTMRTVTAWTLRSQYRTPEFRSKRRANLFALRDFLFGRFGPMGPDVRRVCYGG